MENKVNNYCESYSLYDGDGKHICNAFTKKTLHKVADRCHLSFYSIHVIRWQNRVPSLKKIFFYEKV